MSTLHATSSNEPEQLNTELYRVEDNEARLTTNAKLTALPQQVAGCNTLTAKEQSILQNLPSQACHHDGQINHNTQLPYEVADVFEIAENFIEQGNIATREDLNATEKKFISYLAMMGTHYFTGTAQTNKSVKDTLSLICKENSPIISLLHKLQTKVILAHLSIAEKTLLSTLLKANFSSVAVLPYEATALFNAVDDYIADEYHDFTCMDDGTAALDKRKAALISCLSDAKAFFTKKVEAEEAQGDKNKVVNSLLQLICLQKSNDAALTALINLHLHSYDLYIKQIDGLIKEFPLQKKPAALSKQLQAITRQEKAAQQKLTQLLQGKQQPNISGATSKALAKKEGTIAQTQQTLAQLSQEKASIAAEKAILQTFLAQLAQSRYWQMKMAYCMALLTQYAGCEEALAEAIHTLQYALKTKLAPLHQHHMAGAQAAPMSIDKMINDFLCYLVDTHPEAPKVKASKSIHTCYIAQFRFNLLETIKQDLKNNPQLHNWLNKLNRSGEAIAIEEMITLDVAETLMELDIFIQNGTITLDAKKKVIKEALQKLKEVIILTCTDRFNTIKQQLTAIPTDKLMQQLEQQISLLTITSFINKKDEKGAEIKAFLQQVKGTIEQTCSQQYRKIKKQVAAVVNKENKGQAMKQMGQEISETCTQCAKQLKTLWYSFVHKENKQAAIKRQLQQIRKHIQDTCTQQAGKVKAQVAALPTHKAVQGLTKKIADTATPIGASIRTKTTHFRDLTKQADFTAWLHKLQQNIQAQAANVLPLLGLLFLILLRYYQQLHHIMPKA